MTYLINMIKIVLSLHIHFILTLLYTGRRIAVSRICVDERNSLIKNETLIIKFNKLCGVDK